MKILIINGPNLNWLGYREIFHYGTKPWEEIWGDLKNWAQTRNVTLATFQSNHEGVLIDTLQEKSETVDGIVFNPGAYAHTSIALRDCVASLSVPVVEVHLSKTHQREPFRHHSYVAEVAQASIVGFGSDGYRLGVELLINSKR
ncbi:MAG: type II 3-dehydroquinate dehydratase [Deltaproteobacteria bacterium]|nr:type II 3-dehydroquinate dehydratase [Deltaproteobacteria bacterium]